MRRRTVVALIAGALIAPAPTGLASPVYMRGFVGRLDWKGDDPSFGGFSGIELDADGAGFVALSDRGAVVTGRFSRDAGGRITAVTAARPVALALPTGPVAEDFRFDTEGLAQAADGSLYVSCEYLTRVLHYANPDATPDVLPIPREFVGMDQNGGPESLAIATDGTLYTMPEVTLRTDGTTPVYRFQGGRWDQPFRMAGGSGFLPVGSDIGPDGQLYVLERQFRGLGGFASRVRRMSVHATGVAQAETLLETASGTFGNLEGIAVWRDAVGSLRLTMVSDDNFLAVLGTEIVEFRVPD